ncbi:hypothetical protein [Tateyamaria pelophila]|uniref:hypothetical protein n=1 Tax=Tateyamaria pelophila TaxID=328415 RepID=UPI001CC0F2F8|nr:hypothetical protein [Tateyamaria pelophila]
MDEQEGRVNGEKFTAIVGFRAWAHDLHEIKALFYPAYNQVIDTAIRGEDAKGNYIHRLPNIHGSELLSDFPDEIKFQVLEKLCSVLKEFDVDFLRIGYFDRSFPYEMQHSARDQILDLCVTSTAFAISDEKEPNHVLVSEFDKESLRRNLDKTLQKLSTIYAGGAESSSINLKNLTGHYYATKSEIGCQIADIINYCCLKKSNGTTDFSNQLAKYYDMFSEDYIANQVIWINNRDRIFQMPQKNPTFNRHSPSGLPSDAKIA